MTIRRAIPTLLLLAAPAAWAAELPAAKVIERYKQMLEKSPVEGTVLDRLWKTYADAGKTAQLIGDYRATDTPTAQLLTGHFLRKSGDLEAAAVAYQRAIELDEKNPLPHIALARLKVGQGRHADAAAAFEQAAALLPEADPQRAAILLQLGEAWIAAGELDKGAEAWERTVALSPDDLELRRRLAESYAANRLTDRALPHLEHLEAKAPPAEKATALQQIARIHQAAGDQDAAITALEKALRFTAPGHWLRAELQSRIIRLHQRYHRTPELEARWKKYVEENPRDLSGYLQLIDLYERLGELESQLRWLEKLSALAPKTAEYRVRRARLLAQMDQLDSAAVAYDQLLVEQPGNADLVFERANLDVRRDNPDAAHRRLVTLLELRKNDDSLRSRAVQFYETHRLHAFAEAHLQADARKGSEEAIVSLANFYFGQRREAEARETLQRLVRANDSPAIRAAAHFRIAQFLKAQSDSGGAVAELGKAIDLQPETRDFHLLLGELASSRGNYAEAQMGLKKAVALSSTLAQQQEADQKLFDSLRSQSKPTPGSTVAAFLPKPDGGAAAENPAMQDHLLSLTRAAADQPSAAAWLRLARWQLWNRSARLAQEYAQKALALEPSSIEAREFLVQITEGDFQSPVALAQLEELAEADPARRLVHRRRAGQIFLQRGQNEEALRTFRDLAEAQPGNADALTDLANAQQRLEQWTDALATWQQVYTLTPPARRAEPLGALLRVYERLGTPQPAAELMLAQLGQRDDQKEQFTLFHDLLAHCAKYQLLGWLKERFDERRKGRADDYFTEMAFGRILKAMGNKAAAFEVLADASFAAPDQAAALPELVREAEELRKFDAAIRLQGQLVRIAPNAGVEAWEKLAQLQERNLDTEAAGVTWGRIEAKFPRDAEALQKAADFEMKSGEPARATALLQRLRTLDPTNLRALSALADLSLEAGAVAEARSCFEQILKLTTPEKAGEPLRFPGLRAEDVGRLQSSYLQTVRQRRGRPRIDEMRALRALSGDPASNAKNETELRLNAIRQLAELQQASDDPQALAAWIAQWRGLAATAPSEMLWALFHAGATDEMLTEIEAMSERRPEEVQLRQAFIWLAFQSGEYKRLGSWLHEKERTPNERDFVLVALGQHLQANGGVAEPELMHALFPDGVRLRLWQAAALLGRHGNFQEAVQLGQRLFDGVQAQRAAYGLELAHWYLYLGDGPAARNVLRASLETPGDSFTAPVFTALREYYALLPEEERPAFVETFRESLDATSYPLHRAIGRVVLHGLTGELRAAWTELKQVLDLGAMTSLEAEEQDGSGSRDAAGRHWDFILAAGLQLRGWKMDELAVALWEQALSDNALIVLQSGAQGDRVLSRSAEVRLRLAALKIARASSGEAAVLIEEYARQSSRDGLVPLAEALEAIGAFPRAIALHRQIWEQEPGNPQSLRNLLSACRTGNDLATLGEVLSRCVAEGLFKSNDAAHRDLVLQYLDVLEKDQKLPVAVRIAGEMVESGPPDARFLLRLAQLQERAGHADFAEATYRRLLALDRGHLAGQVALASLLEKAGKVPAAIEALERASGPEADAKLALLYLKADRLDDAFIALERIPAAVQVAPTLLFAEALVAKGDTKQARGAVLQAIARSPDVRVSFPLQSRLIELLPMDGQPAAAWREFRRLRALAGEATEFISGYFDLLLVQASRLKLEKECARELEVEWAGGDGLPAAGLALVEWQLSRGDAAAAEATCATLLARADAGETVMHKLVDALDKAKRPELAAKAKERLARLTPLNHDASLDLARRLHQVGQTPRSQQVLRELAARAILNDEIAGEVAKAFLEIGLPAEARKLFAEAVAADRSARNYAVHLQYARLLREEKDLAGSRQALISAFRNPANREVGEIVAYLAAANRLEEFERELTAFELAPELRSEVRRVVFKEHETAGRAEAAFAIIGEHPELLEGDLPARMRALAVKSGAFASATALLERGLAESPLENDAITKSLASLYGEWAAVELNALQVDSAMTHLRRGHELRPDDFPVARLLSQLCSERGDRKTAAATLDAFIAATTDAVEREKARQLLRRFRS